MHPITWIKQSLIRQITGLMVLLGFTVTSVYAFIDYKKEIRQFHELLDVQAEHLTKTLTLVVANDVRYRKHFELWNKLNEIYQYNTSATIKGKLFDIKSISVIDEKGQVLAHTSPKSHPLGLPYKHPLYPRLGTIAATSSAPGQLRTPASKSLILYMPIRFGSEILGAIIVDFDTSTLITISGRLVTTYLFYMLALILSVVALSIILARVLAKPVQDAVGSLPSLGDGHIALPSLLSRSDELFQLGAAIQKADQRIFEGSRTLRTQQDEIRKLNEELEQRISERTSELVNANKELEAFSYSVSHDLRTPLRSIDGFSQALEEDCQETLDDEAKHYLSRIRAATHRMGQIIDDLLMLAHINRYEISMSDVDLSALAENIKNELEEQSPGTHTNFTIAKNLDVYGDAHLLQIVLENLIGNAWKYSSRQATTNIDFGCERQNDETVFFVRDNGTGFDMQYADKLFGVFQRLHGSEFEGTGIGLATVQRIISRHGGKIWADARINRGATFYFTIPAIA